MPKIYQSYKRKIFHIWIGIFYYHFFTSHDLNRIYLSKKSIDYRDCRNQWIQNDSTLVTQVVPWTCSNENITSCEDVIISTVIPSTGMSITWKENANVLVAIKILLYVVTQIFLSDDLV